MRWGLDSGRRIHTPRVTGCITAWTNGGLRKHADYILVSGTGERGELRT